MLQKQNQWIISISSEQKELIEEICELCKKKKHLFLSAPMVLNRNVLCLEQLSSDAMHKKRLSQ